MDENNRTSRPAQLGLRALAVIVAVLMAPWFFLLGLRELWRRFRRYLAARRP